MRGFRHCYCDSIRHQMSCSSHVLFVIPYHIIVAIHAIHSLDITIISLSDTSDAAYLLRQEFQSVDCCVLVLWLKKCNASPPTTLQTTICFGGSIILMIV